MNERRAVAGNGLLDRRYLLKAGVAGSAAILTASSHGGQRRAWMQEEGHRVDDAVAVRVRTVGVGRKL